VNKSNGNCLDKHRHKISYEISYEITLIALLVIIIVGEIHHCVVTW